MQIKAFQSVEVRCQRSQNTYFYTTAWLLAVSGTHIYMYDFFTLWLEFYFCILTTLEWLFLFFQYCYAGTIIVPAIVSLTNRFHVAVRLFCNKSQMTSKCDKNKKVTHKAEPSVSLMFLPHFDVLCDHYWADPWQHGTYLFYIIKNVNIIWKKSQFYFKFRRIDRHENSTLT